MREWLKSAREKCGLTMKTASERLGISESYYCSIENGVRQKNMDITLASKISVVFGVPLSEVVENERTAPAEEAG